MSVVRGPWSVAQIVEIVYIVRDVICYTLYAKDQPLTSFSPDRRLQTSVSYLLDSDSFALRPAPCATGSMPYTVFACCEAGSYGLQSPSHEPGKNTQQPGY
jgi:hypothetical protein